MPLKFKSKQNNKNSLQLGFGLIELMVSIGIIILVMSVILVKHQSYNGAVLLRSQAYEVALALREIQLNAVSVILEAGEFRNVLGAHFSINLPNSYVNFKDENSNFYYNAANDTQIGKRLNIDSRFEISEIRLGGVATNEVSIVFERPNFDARFFTGNSTFSDVDTVEIDIRVKGTDINDDGAGAVRTVEISRTGQIAVKPTP